MSEEKFVLRNGPRHKIGRQIEALQKAFVKSKEMWLDQYFKKVMPPMVYCDLMNRGTLSMAWMESNGYMWINNRLSMPSDFMIVMHFALFRKGYEVSTFRFEVLHDGSDKFRLRPEWVAKKIYNPEKGGIIIPSEDNFDS